MSNLDYPWPAGYQILVPYSPLAGMLVLLSPCDASSKIGKTSEFYLDTTLHLPLRQILRWRLWQVPLAFLQRNQETKGRPKKFSRLRCWSTKVSLAAEGPGLSRKVCLDLGWKEEAHGPGRIHLLNMQYEANEHAISSLLQVADSLYPSMEPFVKVCIVAEAWTALRM